MKFVLLHRNTGADGCGCGLRDDEKKKTYDCQAHDDCDCREHSEECDCHEHDCDCHEHSEECDCHEHDCDCHEHSEECDCHEHDDCDCHEHGEECDCNEHGEECDCHEHDCGCHEHDEDCCGHGHDCGEETCDCGHEGCDCGHEGCDCGENCESRRRLILETRTAVTLGGIAGALVDLGAESYPELDRICAEAGLDLPKFYADVVKGCRGIRVETEAGAVRDAKWIEEKIARVKESSPDAGALTEQIYRVITATQGTEQGTQTPDYGSFAREDIFTLYAMIAAMLVASDTDGLTVTTVELGFGEFDGVSYPTSLAARFAEGLEIASTSGVRGIDVPAAALVASVTTEQASAVAGLLGACGFGFDGETVTRIYFTV